MSIFKKKTDEQKIESFFQESNERKLREYLTHGDKAVVKKAVDALNKLATDVIAKRERMNRGYDYGAYWVGHSSLQEDVKNELKPYIINLEEERNITLQKKQTETERIDNIKEMIKKYNLAGESDDFLKRLAKIFDLDEKIELGYPREYGFLTNKRYVEWERGLYTYTLKVLDIEFREIKEVKRETNFTKYLTADGRGFYISNENVDKIQFIKEHITVMNNRS